MNIQKDTLSLGLDIGTSGVRGVCINQNLEIVAVAKVTALELDRDDLRNPLLWKKMVLKVFSGLDKQIDLHSIASISVDGQSGTVLLCDDKGEPLANQALLYNDAPNEEIIAELKPLIGSCPASLGRAYQLWRKLKPTKNFHIVHQADWVAGLLCGCFNHSDENNTLKMGYSPLLKTWCFDVSKLPFSASALPKVSTPATFIAYTKTDFAHSIGLANNCRIVTGTTDGMAGFVAASGLNNLSPGVAVTSLGTTLIIKTIAQDNIEESKFGVYSHKLFDVWVAGGASNSGAGVLLNYFNSEQLKQLSKQIDPEIESPLNYYPLVIKGERFPINDPKMTSRVEPIPEDDAEFLAGLFESIARIEKQAYETLDALGAPYPKTIITVGGGSHNEVWTSIRERVLGVDIMTAEQPDPAYGAALIAQLGGS